MGDDGSGPGPVVPPPPAGATRAPPPPTTTPPMPPGLLPRTNDTLPTILVYDASRASQSSVSGREKGSAGEREGTSKSLSSLVVVLLLGGGGGPWLLACLLLVVLFPPGFSLSSSLQGQTVVLSCPSHTHHRHTSLPLLLPPEVTTFLRIRSRPRRRDTCVIALVEAWDTRSSTQRYTRNHGL